MAGGSTTKTNREEQKGNRVVVMGTCCVWHQKKYGSRTKTRLGADGRVQATGFQNIFRKRD